MATTTDLVSEARAYRKRILAADADASARLVRSYGAAFRRIDVELAKVNRLIGERGATAARLYQQGRLQALRALVLEEIGRFSQQAGLVIGGAIDTARELGAEGALSLVDDVTPANIRPIAPPALPTGAVESAVAAFRSQAIRNMLAPLAPEAAQAIEDSIVSGLARGANPKVIARETRRHLGGNLIRALTISRTEMLRAHREGALASYRANREVVIGWTWMAGLSDRTCSSCWAQHGTFHEVDETMDTHPRCRCVAVPTTRTSKRITPGPELFAREPESVQRAVLGPSKLRAYRGNQVALEDFVAHSQHPLWGRSTRAAGLAQARANAEARRAGAARAASRRWVEQW